MDPHELDESASIASSHDGVSDDIISDSTRTPTDRDLKRKYFAKIGRLTRERDEAREEARTATSRIEDVVAEKIAERDAVQADERSRERIFRDYPELESAEDAIQGVRSTFPGMSWDEAKTFYLAHHAPERLLDPATSARRDSTRLDTTGYTASRLSREVDISRMSAREYQTYVSELLRTGQIVL